MDVWMPVAVLVASYLLGSLSFAVIVSRLMGLNDPRSYGSKNPGATNVLRSGSKKAAILTLLLDAFKGWLPVAMVLAWGPEHGLGPDIAALAGLAAFLGHLYPVFFRFAGGKGVATAAGVLLGLHWALGLAVLATWLLVAYFTRYSSLSALVSAVAAPMRRTKSRRESPSLSSRPEAASVNSRASDSLNSAEFLSSPLVLQRVGFASRAGCWKIFFIGGSLRS
jgi:glycerol-3-phosphate acyltransferase PlsY